MHDLQEKDNVINNLKNTIDKDRQETKIKYEKIENELKEKDNKISELNTNIELITQDFEKKIKSYQKENEKLKFECILQPKDGPIFIEHYGILFYLKEMADTGHIPSIYEYALLSDDEYSPYFDKEEALKYFKKAADLGYPLSMHRYAFLLENGDEKIPVNKKEAFKYYKKAADLGVASSMYR